MPPAKRTPPARGVRHLERHRTDHIGWLRAAVLGANDGIVSMSSLLVGVAAASISDAQLSITGVAALVSGAMSMAAGEYVSVSSQSDTESADLAREKTELSTQPEHEEDELATIYAARGLSPELAREVAKQLMVHDALAAHARDELGLSDTVGARPTQAALTSALSFVSGGLFPLMLAVLSPTRWVVPVVSVSSLLLLTALGVLSARVGGAPAGKAALRVGLLGSLAMGLAIGVGLMFGAAP